MSEVQQYILQRLQEDLEALKQQHESVCRDRKGAIGAVAAQLGNQLQRLEEDMLRKEDEIQRQQAAMDNPATQRLIQRLEQHADWEQAVTAYNATRLNWLQRNDTSMSSFSELVHRLDQTLPKLGIPYDARDEFVVRLCLHPLISGPCLAALKAWMQETKPALDWNALQQSLEQESQARAKRSRLGLVLVFAKAEVESGQPQENYYRLSAWLAEHVQQLSTYHQLLDVEIDPAPVAQLEPSLWQVMNVFNKMRRRRCPSITRQPEVHVFLPQELLSVATNDWCCQLGKRPRYFEQEYEVYLHCTERYRDSYYAWNTWHRLWKLTERRLTRPASESFLSGDDGNLDALDYDLAKELKSCHDCDDHRWIGFKLNQPPRQHENAEDSETIFQLLLEHGFPIMLWGRASMIDGSYQRQLNDILAQDLAKLRAEVRSKRAETRFSNTCSVETHMGYHLALVWDDPLIQNPLTA